jgi:hypothetical protein
VPARYRLHIIDFGQIKRWACERDDLSIAATCPRRVRSKLHSLENCLTAVAFEFKVEDRQLPPVGRRVNSC